MDMVSRETATLEELVEELKALGVKGRWKKGTLTDKTILNLSLIDESGDVVFEFKGKTRNPWPSSVRDKQEQTIAAFAVAALNSALKES